MKIDDKVVVCDAPGRIERVKKEGCKRGGRRERKREQKTGLNRRSGRAASEKRDLIVRFSLCKVRC